MAEHAGFIAAAYIVTALALVLIVGWIWLDGRAQKRRLAELEAGGIRRRSDKAAR
jgi:heme exporter protein D